MRDKNGENVTSFYDAFGRLHATPQLENFEAHSYKGKNKEVCNLYFRVYCVPNSFKLAIDNT
jgi:hypothetical protein